MTDMQRTGTNPVTVQTEDPRTLLRLRRMGRELRITDQILSADVDSVAITQGGRAAAWTSADGSSITIDAGRMPTLNTRKGIAVWLGTNAHELFHNLYTPRSESRLMGRVQAAERSYATGIFRSWNVLEDQRIERLGLARYEAWRGYLVAALAHHIPVTHPESWVLVAGRTWLSDEVRAIARKSFVATNGESNARLAAQLIGDYQRLTDPGDYDSDEAWRILNEFHRHFGESVPPKGGCGGHVITEGEPVETDSYSPFPTADEADADDEPEDDEGEDDEGDGTGGDESDDEADDDGDADGDEPGDDGDEGDDEGDGSGDDDDDDGSDTDGDDGSGAGAGDSEGDDADEGDDDDADGDDGGESEQSGDGKPGNGVSGSSKTMAQAITDEVDESLDEDDTSADLDRVQDQLDHGHAGRSDMPKTMGSYLDATDEARTLSHEVSAVLTDIRDECEASWVRRTDSGRFSVARWATDPDWDADNVFDLFDPGAMDASSLEAVLVLDISGSMSGQIHRLAEATWAIRMAVDMVEGSCTGIGFGDDASMMFEQGSRPDGRMFIPYLEGSTNPTTACREAHRIVAESVATNRMVIVLTDGHWWDGGHALAALGGAREAGATTCIIGLGSDAAKYVTGMADHVDVTACIKDSGELVPIFRDMAERSMRAAAGR